MPESLEASLRRRLEDVNCRLRQYLIWVRSLPFPAAILKMADDLGLLARATAGVDGNRCAGNLLKAGECRRARSWDFDSTTDAITYLEH